MSFRTHDVDFGTCTAKKAHSIRRNYDGDRADPFLEQGTPVFDTILEMAPPSQLIGEYFLRLIVGRPH